MKHPFATVAVIAVTAITLTGCSTGSGSKTTAASAAPIKITMLAPLTGSLSSLGVDAAAAAKIAVAQVNKDGGAGGHQIALTVEDDKSDVTQSVTLYNQAAADKSVSLVFSSVSAAASAASGPSAKSTKTPTLSIGPVNSFADGSNPYEFMISPSTKTVSAVLAEYYKAAGIKKLAIGYLAQSSEMPPAAGATVAAAKAAGVDVVLSQSFDVTATDFTPFITHVKQSGADAVQLWSPGAPPAIITKQIAGSGIKVIGTGAQASSLYLGPTGSSADGVALTADPAMVASALPSGPFATLVNSFVSSWKSDHSGAYPPQFAFDAVSAVEVAAAAVKKAGSTDRAALTTALSHLSVLTVGGRFNYSPTDHSGLDASDVTVLEVKDGAFQPTDFGAARLKSDPVK